MLPAGSTDMNYYLRTPGSNFIFYCNSSTPIKWYKDGTKLRYNIKGTRLFIPYIRVNHGGVFICKGVHNGIKAMLVHFKLIVAGKGSFKSD